MHLQNLLLKLAILLSITATSVHAQPTAAMVMIGFDKGSVNASEGNIAVACATAIFLNNTLSTVTVNVSLVNATNSSGQMKAGISNCTSGYYFTVSVYLYILLISSKVDLSDFNVSTIHPLSFTPRNIIQCLRISINEDSIPEGTEIFHLELESMDPFVIITQPIVAVHVLEACYDGEVRLRGGFDENQGRVEICFSGVWGTVCDNGWDDSDADIVCTQLGLRSGGNIQSMHIQSCI